MISRDDDFVTAAYCVLLNRDPEPAGLKHWSTMLTNGLERTEFLHALLSSSLMSASVSGERPTSPDETITCVSLDRLIASGELQLSSLDVVKMDIEGAEVAALPALSRLGKTVDDVWRFFDDLSYKLFAFEHWKEVDPVAVGSLDQLMSLCPSDGLIDALAVPA